MDIEIMPSKVNRIAFIGNYSPRKCGIATFMTDLCEAVASEHPDSTCFAIPVNDIKEGYAYPPRVRFELEEKSIDSYHSAADFLNHNNVDVVSLQHEYGIFGGKAGGHILSLLHDLRIPVVTTFHTVLQNPDANQRLVMEEIARISDQVVVMSEIACTFLRDVYHVPDEKINLIPHGIPDVPFVDPAFHKDQFGVEGQMVLLTFGLLSANKGIENVISALPAILAVQPNVVFILVGATHPQVIAHEGEAYRLSLQRLAQELGVEEHVIFFNRFVSLDELNNFIGAADIYITPYLNEAQVVSGTLAYAVGAGKAVISTPYWYAEEMLAEERGVLVPFHDHEALADAVIELLSNETKRHAMRKRSYLFGRDMVWPEVARRYMACFERARENHHCITHQNGPTAKPFNRRRAELPVFNLNHLELMTDGTGMLQHANFTIPNYQEGYCIDDNSRALIVSILMEGAENGKAVALASRYLAFIAYAFNAKNGRFRNFMSFQRSWLEEQGSEDSHGRALWALGITLGRSSHTAFKAQANQLFEKALPVVQAFTSPRAWAFTLLGLDEYLQRYAGDRLANQIYNDLSARLFNLYQENSAEGWHWFEDVLTYCNAVLPHALMVCGTRLSDPAMVEAGVHSLTWLAEIQKSDTGRNHFVPIGSKGFYPRGGERALFDQQPVEAQTMVSAVIAAHQITEDPMWFKEAYRAFEWFLGRNDLGISLYDARSGGCRDGLHSDRVNENQGAESTLAFMQALLELRSVEISTQPVSIAVGVLSQ